MVSIEERCIVGLDVGTSKVAAIVGEPRDDGTLQIIGVGCTESRGIRRGVVVNLEAAVESIKKALEEAELTAGIEIDAVHLGLSGAHMKGVNSRGVVAVAGKNREIMREDVRRAIEAAKAVTLPSGREIIHVLPQDFVVDEQDGIGAPIGMTGARLEVNVHIVNGSTSSTQNLIACVNRAGVHVLEPTLGQLAAAEAVLSRDEKELGVALVDIGGGTTDIVIYERGSVWHTGVVRGRRRSLHQRHRGRAAHAPARSGADQAALRLRAHHDGRRGRNHGGGQRRWTQAAIDAAPRALRDPAAAGRGDLHLLWDEIRNAGCEKSLNSGLVLTGGGAQLEGMAEIAEQIFDLPVRRGHPSGSGGFIDHVASPEFATAVGLVTYAHSHHEHQPRAGGGGALARAFANVRAIFHGFLGQ